MKSNKGFTLIELLAVIVILAIIALIAMPIVLNVINDAKKGALEQSTYSVINAIENKIASNLLKDPTSSSIPSSWTDKALELKGDKPVCVNVTIDEHAKVSGGIVKFKSGTVTLKADGTVDSSKTVLETNDDTATCTIEPSA